jgi:hypothetical protein
MNIIPGICSLDQYEQWLNSEGRYYHPDKCPLCGCAGKMNCHGGYYRQADRRNPGNTSKNPVLILRFKCKQCKHTSRALPEFLAPRRWYDWNVHQSFVVALLEEEDIKLVTQKISLNEFVEKPASITLLRWVRWFSDTFQKYRFHMVTQSAALGLCQTWQALWKKSLEIQPFSKWMRFLIEQQLPVP